MKLLRNKAITSAVLAGSLIGGLLMPITSVFALSAGGTITGTVINDANNNGIIDTGELGLADWTITLTDTSDSTISPSTVVTDGSGAYEFDGLTDGTYTVCETIPTATPAWAQTNNLTGFSCGAGTFGYQITVSDTSTQSGNDFLVYQAPIIVNTAPVTPTLLTPASGTTVPPTSLTLTWSAVTATNTPVTYNYQSSVSLATTTNNAFVTVLATSATTNTQIAPTEFTTDGTYYWQVQACDSMSDCSVWSDPFTITIQTPAPITPPAPVTSGGGGGGNGPIAGSYGVSNSALPTYNVDAATTTVVISTSTTASDAVTTATTTTATTTAPTVSVTTTTLVAPVALPVVHVIHKITPPVLATTSTSTNISQTASVVKSGWGNWYTAFINFIKKHF